MIGLGRGEAARPMVVAGVMSGTSADGIDVAVCRIGGGRPEVEVLGHVAVPYPPEVREAVLAAMDAERIAVRELSRLSWRLGQLYAAAVAAVQERVRERVELVGCHGQTLYHQAGAAAFLGAAVRCTWQTGEAAVVAERMRCPVVSDFRPADLLAGGQGAPLVPMLDRLLFGSATEGRVLLNLGGIANVTVMPAGVEEVLAFDTGPASMVIDGCMRRLFGREFDRDGAVAREGRAVRAVVEEVLRMPFFRAAPPKSCGREEFGDGLCERVIAGCRAVGAGDADVVATATAVTVESIAGAWRRLVEPRMAESATVEWLVSGGGARNGALMDGLRRAMEGVRVRVIDEVGVAAEAKEAVAFALLAWLTWQGLPGNVPSATGAGRPVVLGKVCFG